MSPYLKPITVGTVSEQNAANHTVLVTFKGDRGLWHCSARCDFLDLVTRQPLVQIITRNGALYMGQDGATEEAVNIAGAESMTLSVKK